MAAPEASPVYRELRRDTDSKGPLPVRRELSWGYIDLKGRVSIRPQFEEADFFYEGVAAVRLHGRWGFVDPAGRFVIPPTYTTARRFSDGLAYVRLDSPVRNALSGYVDTTGEMVIACTPGDADRRLTVRCGYPFFGGFVAEAVEVFRCVDEAGNRVPAEYPCRGIFIDRWGYYDKTGALAIPGPFHSGLGRFSQGLAAAQTHGTPHVGFIDAFGGFAIAPQFDQAQPFSEGLAAVRVGTRWGFIDRTGRRIIEPRFQSAGSFSDGYATIRVDHKVGYIDRSGRAVIPPRFQEAAPFSEGLAAVCCTAERTGYIDTSGTLVISPRFGDAGPFSEGVALARLVDRTAVYIDRKGTVIASLHDRR